MRYIVTEAIIPISEKDCGTDSAQVIKISVLDEVASRWLAIEGINHEPDSGRNENNHQLYFASEKEINEFAAICKQLLRKTGRK